MFKITVDAKNLLGECPLWCEHTRRLFWTNIVGKELLAYHPESGATQRWTMPERLGSFGMTQTEDILLLGLESRLAFFNLQTEALSNIVLSPGSSETRINDGRCDRDGNYVFGTMHEGEPPQSVGAFYRFNAATLDVERLALPSVAIANSLCFSPDGGTMYYCDSLQKRILCCDYPSLDNQRIFAEVSGEGAPDGSCIDAMGFLWNAEWGGSRVVRYNPDGVVDSVLTVPAVQTTCPVMGGDEYDTLYCTSARIGLSSPKKDDGALFEVKSDKFKGLPESRFAGQTK
ncbi:SMP-30/gluconolactonase/LRE family protein [Pectobacterium peruviense]|uniref:SMP-30/gluconolactonase/LRE family protein n=1 Tax=Pectobacterium peruviense TaxID=2066479 RepID=UPI000DE4B456|nr:SMP-30/gluconolactonase/LRE family protein [Pectobacterium peruviense]